MTTEITISAFQDIKTAERESFINKSYFYLLNQANSDYNTMTHSQFNSSIAMGGENEGKK